MARPIEEPGISPEDASRWRTRDIVVTAVIGVAFGVVFWFWNNVVWPAAQPLEAFLPFRDLLYAVWLVPAILPALIVRKSGAALFAEMVAAGLAALLGNVWGVDSLLSGFVQGAAAEIVFAFTLYRLWSLPVLAVAAVASAAAAWIHDWALYFTAVAIEIQLARGLFMAISAVVIAGLGSLLLARALREAGVLEGFPA
jgi:energy-coupling factor transport system substrate-specific component